MGNKNGIDKVWNIERERDTYKKEVELTRLY